MRTPGRANDSAGALIVRCSVHAGVIYCTIMERNYSFTQQTTRSLSSISFALPLMVEYRTRPNQQTLERGSLGSNTYLHDKLIGPLSARSQCGDHQRSGTNPITTSWSPTFAYWAGLHRIVERKQAGENGLLIYNG